MQIHKHGANLADTLWLCCFRPVVLMRLRNSMAPSDVEHQLKFLVYTLERASEVADNAGIAAP